MVYEIRCQQTHLLYLFHLFPKLIEISLSLRAKSLNQGFSNLASLRYYGLQDFWLWNSGNWDPDILKLPSLKNPGLHPLDKLEGPELSLYFPSNPRWDCPVKEKLLFCNNNNPEQQTENKWFLLYSKYVGVKQFLSPLFVTKAILKIILQMLSFKLFCQFQHLLCLTYFMQMKF